MTEDAGHAAVITMNCGGVVLEFSPGAEALLGFSRAEVLGRRLSDVIIPPRLRRAHESGLRRYTETGDGLLVDVAVRLPALHRDGTEIPVDLVVSRARHDGDEAFVGLLRAATEAAPADAELLMRVQFFRALVEHSPNLLGVLDEQGRTLYASPSADATFNPNQDLTGSGFVDAFAHPEDRAAALDAMAQAAAGKLTEPVEFRLRDRDGAWRAVSVQARDLRAHPAVNGVVFYATDATRVRAAERREQVEYTRLLTLVESLNVGILLQDENRRVVQANSAFVEMFDLDAVPERLRGTVARHNPREFGLLFADPVAARDRADEVVRRGRPLFGDEVALVDGRVIERDYVPITLDGSTLGHLWVFRDVTTQAEIRRTLQERNRILTELSALKTEFVAVLSHELRTPLTSIATFAEILDVAAEVDPVEYRAAVGAIRRNADRLLSLVADLLLLARLESGEFDLGPMPVDLGELVRRAAGHARDRRAAGIGGPAGADPGREAVSVVDGPSISGDEELLRQMLDTVFGVLDGMGGDTRVAAAPDGTQWVVRLRAATAEPATTERLLSTRLPHPRYPGEHRTGALALMLARAIATRHGGDLATLVGPGSVTVTVTLPVAGNRPADRSSRRT